MTMPSFYTGKQRIVDTGGRVDRFNKRFGALSSKKYSLFRHEKGQFPVSFLLPVI